MRRLRQLLEIVHTKRRRGEIPDYHHHNTASQQPIASLLTTEVSTNHRRANKSRRPQRKVHNSAYTKHQCPCCEEDVTSQQQQQQRSSGNQRIKAKPKRKVGDYYFLFTVKCFVPLALSPLITYHFSRFEIMPPPLLRAHRYLFTFFLCISQ